MANPNRIVHAVVSNQHDKAQGGATLTTVDRFYFGYSGTYSASNALVGWRIRVR